MDGAPREERADLHPVDRRANEVVVELDGSVLIKYPFQLANFEKAGLGSIKFSALAARALKAVLNASERVKPVELGASGSRPIH